ncbi:MAG: hypothetical protein FWD04_09700 [Conexibacteraceae bacterium]|nr:hypothetical protein [Conexibacteraceae bacterium]
MASDFDLLMGLWEDGQRRVAAAEGAEGRALERVVAEIVLDLRRRLGGKFTTDELAEYYLREGTDWCFQIAYSTAPGSPEAWDVGTVAGAAFARYVRRAVDWGGGVRREQLDE